MTAVEKYRHERTFAPPKNDRMCLHHALAQGIDPARVGWKWTERGWAWQEQNADLVFGYPQV